MCTQISKEDLNIGKYYLVYFNRNLREDDPSCNTSKEYYIGKYCGIGHDLKWPLTFVLLFGKYIGKDINGNTLNPIVVSDVRDLINNVVDISVDVRDDGLFFELTAEEYLLVLGEQI